MLWEFGSNLLQVLLSKMRPSVRIREKFLSLVSMLSIKRRGVLTTRSVSTSRESGLVFKRVTSQWSIFEARGRPGRFDSVVFLGDGFLRGILSWARSFLISRSEVKRTNATAARTNVTACSRIVTVGSRGRLIVEFRIDVEDDHEFLCNGVVRGMYVSVPRYRGG